MAFVVIAVVVAMAVVANTDTNTNATNANADHRRNGTYVVVAIPEGPPQCGIPPAAVIVAVTSVPVMITMTMPDTVTVVRG